MPPSVFLSYSRDASAGHARALAARLGGLAFLDTTAIDDGDRFPERLLDAILDASVVVVFATKEYPERRFCRLEMRLALAGGDPQASHIVAALGEGCDAVLDALPAAVAGQNWPPAEAAERLDALVRARLAKPPMRQRLPADEARRLAAAFLEESKLPPVQPLRGIVSALPPGVAGQSIGARFLGRADLLRRIHERLAGSNCRIVAGGGFGKTRLAAEYLHRYGAAYYPGGVFWVNAESGAIVSELWRVLAALDPKVPNLAGMREQKRDVRRELEFALRAIGRRALYVIDNIPEAAPGADPPSIADFCPAPDAVTVLATSRQDTREESVRSIPVDTLEAGSAILLLTEGLPGSAALAWEEWGRIADWVGGLPLALDLLNRALALGSIAPRALLERVEAPSATVELDRQREALRGQVPANAIRGITEALSLSYEKLDGEARQMAQLLAQMAPAPIPEAFMEALPQGWNDPGVRAALRSRNFVVFGGDLSFGTMHRLLADFLRVTAAKSTPPLIGQACAAMRQVMTPERCRDPLQWPLMRLCRPHAEALFARGSASDDTARTSIKMGVVAAILASEQGDYDGARRIEARVVDLNKRLLGKEHKDTLSSMNSLALTLLAQADFPNARRLQEQVVAVSSRVLGDESPETLNAMNSLAMALGSEGDHAGARKLQAKTLEAGRRVLGEEDSFTRKVMNNLSMTLFAQGDLRGARLLQKQVLDLNSRLLGNEHPDTLVSMNNLALTLRALGDLAGSRAICEQVLEVRKRVLGERHPETLASMNNLADTLRAQGDLAGARRLQEPALEFMTEVFGAKHPSTLTVMNNLAATRWSQGDFAAARELQDRVVEVATLLLGEEHPSTLMARSNLGELMRHQRDPAGAQRLGEQVLAARKRILGAEHPDTLTSMSNLALALSAQGDHAGAQRLWEQALEGRKRVLGEEHPDTLTSMSNLAWSLRAQGDSGGARQLEEAAVEARKRVLGPRHPDTLLSMANLAVFLSETGDVEGGARLLRQSLAGLRSVLGEDHPFTVNAAVNLKRIGGTDDVPR